MRTRTGQFSGATLWYAGCSSLGVPIQRQERQCGFTLVELMITVAIISAAAAMAIPKRDSVFELRGAHSTFVADMRMARGSAIAEGVHFRLEIFDATTYGILRLMEAGGGWVQDGDPEIERSLPPHVTFSGSVGDAYEFNTRGLVVEPATQATITLVDGSTGQSRTVDLWPSGQVVPDGTL